MQDISSHDSEENYGGNKATTQFSFKKHPLLSTLNISKITILVSLKQRKSCLIKVTVEMSQTKDRKN